MARRTNMRILQICSAREIGGGEKHLADLANQLAQRGHDVFVALHPASPVRALLPSLSADNVIELPMRNALNLATAVKLSRFARQNQIDIVHAHVARDYPLAALATGRSRARLVLTRHVLFPMSGIHRLTRRRTARVIAVSEAVAEALRRQRIFDPETITVIHNGIDLARFAPRDDQPHRNFRVGMIGHLAPIKGQEEFIRAAATVCAGRDDVEFVIAGEDKSKSGEHRELLEKLIAELNLADRVRLLGWVEDTPRLLSTLDLFISPARSEPFGLSIVEAMAAGVPVIATMSEGAREIIRDGETGWLVAIADSPALARAILSAIDDPAQRSLVTQQAHAKVRARFSLEKMVTRTEGVYEEALNG